MYYNELSFLGSDARDHDADIRFDRVTALAASVIDAPISLLTLIDDASDRQLFRAAMGLPVELMQVRSTPLRYSFCKHVRDSGEALILDDARKHPLHMRNPAINEFGVVSYLGLPLHGERGEPIGALCCIDVHPRDWTDVDVHRLTTLASVADDQFKFACAIRDRARAELIAEQATTARASFLSHANHEVRTPLSAISGAARLLSAGSLDTNARSLANVIERNASRLRALTDDLVRIAELEGNRAVSKEETLNIIDVIDNVVSAHRPTATAKGIVLKLNDQVKPDSTFVSDSEILTGILNRIVSNAIKFTECGEVDVTAESTPSETEIFIRVKDTGVGIDEKLIRKIFDEFEGHHPDSARRGGGTGLGMNILKREVELLKGGITISSIPKEGTTISICFPHPLSSSSSAYPATNTHRVRGQLTCLECGKEMGLLRRHLVKEHGMSPEEYRRKWGLPESFEFSSVAYQEIKSRIRGRQN